MSKTLQTAVIGASGYTGFELVKLLLNHPQVQIKYLIANSNSGHNIGQLYPSLAIQDLPVLIKIEEADFTKCDVAFCCLPHTTSQIVIGDLHKKYPSLVIIDLSADFRLSPEMYKKYYGHDHAAPNLQKSAVYGLSEFYREEIRSANIIACPGCYPTSINLALKPLAQSGILSDGDTVLADSKSGITGAGRSLKEQNLFCERNDNFMAYSLGTHRHESEIVQELCNSYNLKLNIDFVPHLLPVNRGILSTIYLELQRDTTLEEINEIYAKFYKKEKFVHHIFAADHATSPSIKDVAYSNNCIIKVFKSNNKPNRFIIVSVLDNLIKGASGQAIQNMNIRFGFDESAGLSNISAGL